MPGMKPELPDIKLLKGGSTAGSKQSSAAPSPAPSISSIKDDLSDTPKTPKTEEKEDVQITKEEPKENGKTDGDVKKENEVKENGDTKEVCIAKWSHV